MYRRLFSLTALLMAASVGQARAQDAPNPVTLDNVPRAGGIEVWVRNSMPGPVTVDVTISGTNMRTSVWQKTLMVAAGGSQLITTLSQRDPRARWSYQDHYHYQLGARNAQASPYVYDLPFGPGLACKLAQGYFGTFSHQKVRALDFHMPEGSEVRAARDGTVMATESRYSEGGVNEALKSKANYVEVAQSDGTVASYFHLQHDGVQVQVGQHVARGDVLGLSGNTGYSSQAHLHFQVSAPTNGTDGKQTFATRFRLPNAPEGDFLVVGQTYTSN